MRSGIPSVARSCRMCYLLLAAMLMSAGVFAQQSTGANPGTPANQVEIPSAAQPVSQPAQAPSGAISPVNASDESKDKDKDAADQSSMMKLGSGDLIEVSVYNVPELTTKARVSSAGDVYLPLIDYVHVEGLTQEEAQALIEKRLTDGGFVRSPHVSIFVDEATSQGVTIIGEVAKPGIYPDVADHKLYEVISEAGGFTLSASRKLAIIRQGKPDAIRVSLPRNLGDDLSGNIEIMPGDTITVPRAPIVYVVGDVNRPSGLLIDNGSLTVLQALALAGGANHTAKMGGVRIIRKTPTGLTETPVQLKKMLEAKTADVPLQPDDILFVPMSGVKVAASKTADVALSAATAVAVYALH
jgi:polysaccharide biosynthesis/export protein